MKSLICPGGLGKFPWNYLIKIMLNCIQTRSQGFSYLVPISLTVKGKGDLSFQCETE